MATLIETEEKLQARADRANGKPAPRPVPTTTAEVAFQKRLDKVNGIVVEDVPSDPRAVEQEFELCRRAASANGTLAAFESSPIKKEFDSLVRAGKCGCTKRPVMTFDRSVSNIKLLAVEDSRAADGRTLGRAKLAEWSTRFVNAIPVTSGDGEQVAELMRVFTRQKQTRGGGLELYGEFAGGKSAIDRAKGFCFTESGGTVESVAICY